MPLYEYRCYSCDKTFEIRHSYKVVQNFCIICGDQACVEKIMSRNVINRPLVNKTPVATPVGTITHEAIKDAKSELEKQKTDLKKKNK